MASAFIEYVIDSKLQQYLIDYVLKTIYDKGERKYLILNLEKVQIKVSQIFEERLKEFRDSKPLQREYEEDHHNRFASFLVGVRQIFHAIFRNEK